MFYEKIKQQLFFLVMQKKSLYSMSEEFTSMLLKYLSSQSDKTLIGINLVQIWFVNWKFM